MEKVKETKTLVSPNQEDRMILDGLIEYINRVCSINPKRKACLVALLLLFGGAFACKNANAAPAKEPTNIEQLNNEEETPKEAVITALPEVSPTPSQTPMDASAITPEVAITPVPFLIIDEDESNKMAMEFLNDLNKLYLSEFDIEGLPFQENQNNIIIIKMLFGDFSDFQNYYNSGVEEEQWERKKSELFQEMRYKLSSSGFLMANRMEKKNNEKDFVVGSLNLGSRYDDSFAGKETLLLLENMTMELGDYLDQKEELIKKAQLLQDLIYNIYYNTPDLDKKFTPYKDMHPLIQMAFIYSISQTSLLDIRILLSSSPVTGEEEYTAIKLYQSFNGEYYLLKESISQYIDEYLNSPTLTYTPTPGD